MALLLVAVCAATGRTTIFVPGPGAAVHAKNRCLECHRPWSLTNTGFLGCVSQTCHTKLVNRNTHGKVFDLDCARCHVEHVSGREAAGAIRREIMACLATDPECTKVHPKLAPLGDAWRKRVVNLLYEHSVHIRHSGSKKGQTCDECHFTIEETGSVAPLPIHPKRAEKKKCETCHSEDAERGKRFSKTDIITARNKCMCHHVADEPH